MVLRMDGWPGRWLPNNSLGWQNFRLIVIQNSTCLNFLYENISIYKLNVFFLNLPQVDSMLRKSMYKLNEHEWTADQVQKLIQQKVWTVL